MKEEIAMARCKTTIHDCRTQMYMQCISPSNQRNGDDLLPPVSMSLQKIMCYIF